MTPNHFFGRIRMLGIASVLLVQAAWVCAQLPDKLPPSPDYLGEIRRTPDGKLRAVAEEKRFVRSAEAVATMIVGPGEKLTTITEAARLAKDGEVIEIRSGDYRGQPVVWTQK